MNNIRVTQRIDGKCDSCDKEFQSDVVYVTYTSYSLIAGEIKIVSDYGKIETAESHIETGFNLCVTCFNSMKYNIIDKNR